MNDPLAASKRITGGLAFVLFALVLTAVAAAAIFFVFDWVDSLDGSITWSIFVLLVAVAAWIWGGERLEPVAISGFGMAVAPIVRDVADVVASEDPPRAFAAAAISVLAICAIVAPWFVVVDRGWRWLAARSPVRPPRFIGPLMWGVLVATFGFASVGLTASTTNPVAVEVQLAIVAGVWASGMAMVEAYRRSSAASSEERNEDPTDPGASSVAAVDD